MTTARAFRGYRFPAEVILWAVRWYLQFPISYRDLERMLADRGVEVDHVAPTASSPTRTGLNPGLLGLARLTMMGDWLLNFYLAGGIVLMCTMVLSFVLLLGD